MVGFFCCVIRSHASEFSFSLTWASLFSFALSQWICGNVHVQLWVQLVSTQLSTRRMWDVREGQSVSVRCGWPQFKSRPCHLAAWPWANGISPGSLSFIICRMGWCVWARREGVYSTCATRVGFPALLGIQGAPATATGTGSRTWGRIPRTAWQGKGCGPGRRVGSFWGRTSDFDVRTFSCSARAGS